MTQPLTKAQKLVQREARHAAMVAEGKAALAGMAPPERTPYPAPSHCISLWLAGDHLCVALPPSDQDSARGHVVRVPLANCSIERTEWGTTKSSHRGWEALLGILMDRARLQHNPRAGVPACPTQYDIDAIVRALGEAGKPTRFQANGAPKIELSANDLGL